MLVREVLDMFKLGIRLGSVSLLSLVIWVS